MPKVNFSEGQIDRLGETVKDFENRKGNATNPPSNTGQTSRRPNPFFAVLVLKDGGTNGSGSTTVSWTYTVKVLDGTVVGTAKTPKKRRMANMKYVDPLAVEYEGIAYFDIAGALQLYDANEVLFTELCE